MFDIDVIIPCYGKSEIISMGIASLMTQWHSEFIHVTLVNDCSPNTDCNYQDLIDRYGSDLDIRCITTPQNGGQGLARQYGIDNTSHDYFMFMDEDDRLGNNLAVSMFVGAVEGANIKYNEDGSFNVDENGKPAQKEDAKPVSVVSAPLFEFDDNHTRVIENTNRIWLNSKLYSRRFIEKHNVRFNGAQSRHAEDYYWMSCFFHAMDNDQAYQGILMDNNGIYYLWYPNMESQSRTDADYGYMLSGYTTDGSVNILKYMRDSERSGIEWTGAVEEQYRQRVLNMTVYSYFTFQSFVRHVAETDYVPKLEQDWYILRDACNELRKMLLEYFDTYTSTKKIEEYHNVKNFTDVMFTEPWVDFDTYVKEGCDELKLSFGQLLETKQTMKFNDEGVRIWEK